MRIPPYAQHFGLAVCLLTGLSACTTSPAEAGKSAAIAADPLAARVAQIKQHTLAHMVNFPAGTFEMGDWGPYDAFSKARPVHTVTLDGFAMMAYKVSYEDFDAFTDSVGEQRVDMDDFGIKYRAPNKPAGVSWYGAKAYCQWLGKLTGQPFDLATEAQWEYAARSGGQKLLFATDNGKYEEGHNYPIDNQIKIRLVAPDIGSYPPNPAGLYGMLDYSSQEWVQDWYDPNYYKHSPVLNPQGGTEQDSIDPAHPQFGPRKVLRGLQGASPNMGGFVFSRGYGRIKYKLDLGNQFRCVINPTPATPSSSKSGAATETAPQ